MQLESRFTIGKVANLFWFSIDIHLGNVRW